MKPQAGGEYVYIRDGYGPLAGFLYAWTWFLIAKPASIATLATGFVRVLGNFSALSFLSRNLISVPFHVTYGQPLAIAAAVLISLLNYLGVKKAGEFQLVFTVLKIGIILGIVFIGFTYASGTWRNFAGTYSGAAGGMAGFMAALVAALWAYDGWNDLNMVSGEIRDPERSIPIAFFFQAEDGIRVLTVTGVQTCALPISCCWRRCAARLPLPHRVVWDTLPSTPASLIPNNAMRKRQPRCAAAPTARWFILTLWSRHRSEERRGGQEGGSEWCGAVGDETRV